MQAKGIVYSAVVFVVLSQIINTIEAIFTMGYYTNPVYFGLWSKLMMSTNGPPGAAFYAVSVAVGLISGLIFAWSYSLFGKSVPGKGIRKGFNYGIILFLIAGVPFTLTLYLLLAVPTTLLIAWAISSLAVYILSGICFSKIIK